MLKKQMKQKTKTASICSWSKKYKSKSTLNSWSSIFLMAFKAKRRFLKIYESAKEKNLKNLKKELPCFFTPSALEK